MKPAPELRSPENRKKAEARKPNCPGLLHPESSGAAHPGAEVGLRASAFGFLSDFALRTSHFLLPLLLLLAGCVNPIGADRISSRQAQKQLAASALTGQLSETSRRVLHRFELEAAFARTRPPPCAPSTTRPAAIRVATCSTPSPS